MSAFIITLSLILFIFLFLVTIVLHGSSLLSYFIGGAPFLPTPVTTLDKMLELAQIQPGELVYDLGCGDGRLLIEANLSHKARAVGIEISPLFCWIARVKANVCKASIIVIKADIMQVDFSNADIVFCYLMPEQMEKLKNKFLQLKKGSRIISLRFELPDWEPVSYIKRNDHIQHPPIFKYQI